MKNLIVALFIVLFVAHASCKADQYRYEEGVKSYLSALGLGEKDLLDERILIVDIACNCKQTLLKKIANLKEKSNLTLILVGKNKVMADKYSQIPVKKLLLDSNAIAFRYETGLANPLFFSFKNGEIVDYFLRQNDIEQELLFEQ
jgi:hypothetical protein